MVILIQARVRITVKQRDTEIRLRYRNICLCLAKYCKGNRKTYPKDKKVLVNHIPVTIVQRWKVFPFSKRTVKVNFMVVLFDIAVL